MAHSHLGSCLCGAVRFKIDGDFDRFYLCHCEYCRKDTGSAHAANLFSASASLAWERGEDKVTTFNLPETRHTRSFCSTCGSALPYVSERMLVVPAGCLNTEVPIVPDANIFVASKARWEHDLANLPAFDSFPS